MNKFGKQVWTEPQDRVLASLWFDGMTATKIADRMSESGRPTRNAVIGRIHRLKLKRGPAEISLSPKAKKKHRRDRTKAKRVAPFRKPLPDLPQPVNLSVPFGNPCTLVDLHEHSCRWPIGEVAPYLYCNAVREEIVPYCKDHCAVAYKIMRDIREKAA